MAFGLFGLSALGSGLVDQLSQNDIDAMNKLKLQDEQSTLEAQKYAGTILQNNPEIAAQVLGSGGLGGFGGAGGLGGFPGMGGGQPQYPPQQPPYQPPRQQPMAPQPGQPSVPMQPLPQQAALQPGAGSNLTGPNTVSYTPQPPTNPDPRINALQRIAAGQGTPTAQGVSPLAAVPVDAYQQLRDQQHQPWLGPNNAPVGPAANAPRPAPPPGVDPNAPRPMPPQQAAAPQQRPQQPPQQDAGYGGGGFPPRGLDLRDAIARMQQRQPNMKPEVMFKTLMLLQKALNPESRLQLQQLGLILRDREMQERIRQGDERIRQGDVRLGQGEERLRQSGIRTNALYGDTPQTLSPTQQSYAQRIANLQMAPPSTYQMQRPFWQGVMNGVADINPGYKTSDYAASAAEAKLRGTGETRADIGSLTKLQQSYDVTTAFENNAKAQGRRLVQLADKVDETGVPVLERWIRAGRRATGDPDVARLNAQMTLYRAEVAKIMTSPNLTGVLTDAARHEVEAGMSDNASADQIRGVVELLENDMELRRSTLGDQLKEVRGRIKGGGGAQQAPAGGGGGQSVPMGGGWSVQTQ